MEKLEIIYPNGRMVINVGHFSVSYERCKETLSAHKAILPRRCKGRAWVALEVPFCFL